MNKLRTVSKVLQVKGYKKEELELEVKKIREQINLEQSHLDSLKRTFSETIAQFDKRQEQSPINVHELELFYNYLLQLYGEIDAQKKVISRRFAELGERQNALVEAYKEKKLFEIMKGKIIHKDIREKAVSEQKEVDYMFLSRRRRNR